MTVRYPKGITGVFWIEAMRCISNSLLMFTLVSVHSASKFSGMLIVIASSAFPALAWAEEALLDPAHLPGQLQQESGRSSFLFEDEFDRENAPSLGRDWTDCKSLSPDHFEPLGVYNDGVVVAAPFTRPGIYDETPPSGHPPTDNRLFPAIGCAVIDTNTTEISVKIVWSGNHGVDHPPPISHVEGTPLLYVTPGNTRFGFGAWFSTLFGVPVIFAGYIGMPVETFEVVATARLPFEHYSGEPREIELRAQEAGKVTVFVDGEQIDFGGDIGLQPFVIDSELAQSTLHGIAVDAHAVDPVENITILKSIERVEIRQIE